MSYVYTVQFMLFSLKDLVERTFRISLRLGSTICLSLRSSGQHRKRSYNLHSPSEALTSLVPSRDWQKGATVGAVRCQIYISETETIAVSHNLIHQPKILKPGVII
jgi:hypothetical protein